MKRNARQCSARQCNEMQCNIMQGNAMQCNAMQWSGTMIHSWIAFVILLPQQRTSHCAPTSKYHKHFFRTEAVYTSEMFRYVSDISRVKLVRFCSLAVLRISRWLLRVKMWNQHESIIGARRWSCLAFVFLQRSTRSTCILKFCDTPNMGGAAFD
jgi:hypothetical protein